jgi:DNA-binding IclR family transcriptional regulator
VLDILELLSQPANEALRFSDIVAALGLTQATAHAILMTLCDRGWLVRDPKDKTFAFGPAFAVVAARVEGARPLVHAARQAAQELSAALGYAASVVERIDDELVITAFEGQSSGVPGDRIRYAPPFGVAFAAWDGDDGQQDWIDRAPSGLADRLKGVLAQTRERGYDVDWTTPELTRAAQIVGSLPSDGLPDHVRGITDQLLAEFTTIGLQPTGAQPVATIAAPVFDRNGHVALILSVHPLQTMTPRQVEVAGRRVMRAAGGLLR